MVKENREKIATQSGNAKRLAVFCSVSWRSVYQFAVIWAIGNIIIGFLISQGSSEDSVYVGAIYLALIVAGSYIALRINHFTLYKSALAFSITGVLVFALLDYLIVNLLLEGNILHLYSEWYIALSYALVALVPLIPFSVKVFKLKARRQATK